MKKRPIRIFLVLSILFVSMVTVAQEQSQPTAPLAISSDDILLEVFYGSPAVNMFSEAPKARDVLTEFGVIGLRIEFVTSYLNAFPKSKFGFGIETSYSSGTARENFSYFVPSQGEGSYFSDTLITYSYSVFRLIPRLDFHVLQSEKMDFNVGLGIGTFKVKSDEVVLSNNVKILAIEKPSNPISMRFFLGGKYFVSDKLGMTFNTGIGGGYIVKLGLVFKV